MNKSGNEILVGTLDDQVCVKVDGKGTHLNSQPLREFLFEMIDEGFRVFHLDVNRCSYMDSTFLGMLVGVSMRLKKVSSNRITISRINPRNLELFQTLGIEQFFQIETDGASDDSAPAETLQSLPQAQAGTEQWAESVLEAHETLARADEKNLCRFKDVITFLKEDLARLKSSRHTSPAEPEKSRNH